MRRVALIILLALVAGACQSVKADPDAVSLTRTIYDELRMGRDTTLAAHASPALQMPQAAAQFAKLRNLLPPGEPRSMKLVGQAVRDVPGKGRAEMISLEYDYGAAKTLFQTRLFRAQGAHDWRLAAFNLRAATVRQLAPDRLTPVGKSPLQYAYLALALSSPLMMIAALVKVLWTPGLTYKWAWAPLCFIGLVGFQQNWATGQTLVVWNSVQFFGFWLSNSGSAFDPWFITATAPVVALLVLAGVLANPPRAAARAPA
jgi:hypothetical protein